MATTNSFPGRSVPSPEGGAGAAGFTRDSPAYAAIAAVLREAIASGRLGPGAVLLEGPLAALFGSSRSPVKQALQQLCREGLVARFAGRGLMVGDGSAAPCRVPVTATMLELCRDSDLPAAAPLPALGQNAGQKLYYEVERALILTSVFGRFRVNELALARHFGVGRTVARDVLLTAQAAGILTKDEKSHWYLVPLDASRFADLYELRCLLEPAAIRTAAGHVPPGELAAMAGRLEAAEAAYPQVGVAALDALETDLHVRCIGLGRNAEIVGALARTRCLLVSGKHIQAALSQSEPVDNFMGEHLAIIRALQAENGERAARFLLDHLTASRRKAVARLAAFHAGHALVPVAYIQA
ncbi:GntR family transcriptional regulator [Pseudoxanthobacter sp.]|uniref:GntR family transcriptional regulator n=1 Tax=Pseudoxanthobacter sp. TaxID=1925742 RepID=UPI002FE3BD3B